MNFMDELLDLLVDRHLLEDGIEFLHLQTIRGVLLVFGGDVTGHSRLSAGLVLGTFQDYLDTVAFLRHFFGY